MSDEAAFLPLDTECAVCHGEGQLRLSCYERPHTEPCYECDGLGRVPTEFGKAVLAFVQARLKITTNFGAG